MNIWQLGMVLVGLVPSGSVAGKPVDKKNGIVTIPSHHSADETVKKLKSILQSKGIALFALIDTVEKRQKRE